MTPESIQSLPPAVVHCARTAVAVLAAGLAVAMVFGAAPQTNAPAGGLAQAPFLPGRIYRSAWRTPPEGGTIVEVLSFDPNTGSRRAEPLSSDYEVASVDPSTGSRKTEVLYSGFDFLRIAPLTKTAAYTVFLLLSPWEEVVTARLDRSAKDVRILRTTGITSLAWAPDGVRLVVTTWVHKDVGREGGLPRTETWLVKSDGSDRTRLPVPDTHVVLDWSPDGKFLLTWVPPRTQPHPEAPGFPTVLYTMGLDGTRVTRVSADGEESHYGRISPDSTSIAYFWARREAFPNPQYGLSILKTNGAGRREIMHESTAGFPMYMCWCPDGRHLAVQIHEWKKDSFGLTTIAGAHVEIYDLGGNRLRTLAPKDAKFYQDSSLDWQ